MLTYTMSAPQSDDLDPGRSCGRPGGSGDCRHVVTLTSEDVLVLVDDGSVAFTLMQLEGQP